MSRSTTTPDAAAWPTAEALARAFSRALAADLTPEQLATVRAANAAEADPRICHSGDHCDSNMTMLAAFEALGFDVMERFDTPDHDRALVLWNEAWGLAQRGGFRHG